MKRPFWSRLWRGKKALPYLDDAEDDALASPLSPIDDDLEGIRDLLNEGALAEARDLLTDLHRRFPEDPRAIEMLYEIAHKKEDAPGLGRWAGLLIQSALNRHDYGRAQEVYESIVLKGPEIELHPDILFKFGQEFAKSRNPILGLKAFLHLGFLYPNAPNTLRVLVQAGDLYADRFQNPKKAYELFSHLQECYPQSPMYERIRASLKRTEKMTFRGQRKATEIDD